VSPVATIQARIAAIESRFGAAGPARGAASGAAFGQVLARVTAGGAAGASTAAVGTGRSTGTQIVDLAKQHLGTPYVWGGTDPAKGFDCSGFVQYVFGQAGIDLPRVSRDQARAGQPVASLADARPGDLVAFGSPVDHIGIYAGDNKMVVAPHRGDVVKIQEITSTPTAIRRIVPDVAAAPAGAAAATGTGFDQLFAAAGARHGVSPALLAAVAKAESSFNPRAVSHAGAQGLMQLMPGTARGLGVDPFDPAQAIDGAARLLADHQRRFGSVDLALAAYNAGPGAVQRHGGMPPYSETRNYVRRVLAFAGGTP
jgi:cell wall-associated NlpC family hydrolase